MPRTYRIGTGMTQVDLWLADMDQHVEDLVRFESVLTNEERAKRVGIRLERVRNHSILSRGILRSILAPYIGCDAKDVEIETEPLGKPKLGKKHSAAFGNKIHFNLSHSDGLLAIVVSGSGPVGVDVEKIREVEQLDSIASTLFLVDQQTKLSTLRSEERLELFFQYWVHREAVTKAMGVGFMEHVEIEYSAQSYRSSRGEQNSIDELCPKTCVSKLSGSAMEWSLLEFSPRTGYTGCIALARGEHTLRMSWF
jgi:4'-phosphopantetheinyl transferase